MSKIEEVRVLRDNGNKKPLREITSVITIDDLENRLPDIFPTKLGLSEINREL